MRKMLIEEIKELSKIVDNDDLDWFPWDKYSNKKLLDMFGELYLANYILSHPGELSKE